MTCDCKQCQVRRIFTRDDEPFNTIGAERMEEFVSTLGALLGGALSFVDDASAGNCALQIFQLRAGMMSERDQRMTRQ